VSRWPATRAARVYGALLRIGWQLKRQAGGSHRGSASTGSPIVATMEGMVRRLLRPRAPDASAR
jgi:predicted RNA binding protein YcfA (HicA-like mRNA interferase family)